MANIFTFEEYKEFVKEYWVLAPHEHFPYTRRFEMKATYRERLPVYLLARCPICGGRVEEPIDTFSLNGPGWEWISARGYGWFGKILSGQDKDSGAFLYHPSYHADCEHVQVVDWCVNLNRIKPTDVILNPYSIDIHSEIPYVMTLAMQAPDVSMVLHAIPVGRFDKQNSPEKYTCYFMTYFARNAEAFEQVMPGPFEDTLVYGILDIHLKRWAEEGRVCWLDPGTPDLPLICGTTANFPYGNVQGNRYGFIKGGKFDRGDPINRLLAWAFK
jgi:hypothetical protein